MRRPPLAAALAIAVLAPLAALPAQSIVAAVGPGARVRLAAPALQGEFFVLAATPDTLVVQRDPTAPVHRLAVASLQRVDVSRGRRSAGAGFARGLLVGGGIGAAIGVASGLASGDDEPAGWFSMSAEQKALGGGLVAGVAGGVVGGVVGLAVRGERWDRLATGPRVALTVPPTGRGAGLRLAGAF